MDETAKYLIHAEITAAGVVERSDVVGAVFGQTEGLLGDELDLRDLQDSKKVGRIDVDIRSESGTSFGEITVGSGLDKVQTAILAAAFETIDQVGPCSAEIVVTDIEDIRSAKRRAVVERATELLVEFDAEAVRTEDIVETVRQRARVDDITTFEGLPAGPRVADSDAIVVVEGRADVLTLLRYGIKNAVAVEGTDVPAAVADLTSERTVTAFLDGDRGGELILKELSQVGTVDYVAFAPEGRCVEDLARREVMAALREKVPYESVSELESPTEAVSSDGPGAAVPAEGSGPEDAAASAPDGRSESGEARDGTTSGSATDPSDGGSTEATNATAADAGGEDGEDGEDGEADDGAGTPETLPGHVRDVIGGESARVRLLDGEFRTVREGETDEAFDLVADAEEPPAAVVLDGELSQRVLDVAAQRGVGQVVAASTGEFVKKPTSVRVRTADQLLAASEA